MALLAVVGAAAALVGGFIALNGLSGGSARPHVPTAAIVDQLSLTAPNPRFAEAAGATLERAGYRVDYFPGEAVTVDFFRALPRRAHDVLLLRVHAAEVRQRGSTRLTGYVGLFTNEPYSEARYVEERSDGGLIKTFYYQGGPKYVGIAPAFVASRLKGRFDGALIVAMGCSGLSSAPLAQAFLDRGASAFVSWDREVSADHTDAAALRFLEHLLIEQHSVQAAARLTNDELGPDPVYGARLLVLTREP